MKCYCGSGIEKELCCLKFIKKEALPESVQELMRSRYSAYVLGDGRYLVDTNIAKNRYEEDVALISEHAKNTQWLKLEIIKSYEKGLEGFVEFKAYYRENSKIHLHHEKSTFLKVDGVWLYEEGELLKTAIGRNEPCPCGSGKKYKRCCAK
jgi:SEC-C motif-containing protein